MYTRTDKVFHVVAIVAILISVVAIGSCLKDARKTAERVQQMEDNDKIVEINGLKWKRTTFFDEYKRCWKIYTHGRAPGTLHGGVSGVRVFATPCPKE